MSTSSSNRPAPKNGPMYPQSLGRKEFPALEFTYTQLREGADLRQGCGVEGRQRIATSKIVESSTMTRPAGSVSMTRTSIVPAPCTRALRRSPAERSVPTRSGAKSPILPARMGSPASRVGATTTQSAPVARSLALMNYHRHYPVRASLRVRSALDAVRPSLDGVAPGEEIPVARHRLQVDRPVGIGFNLVPQVHHVPPDQTVVA
jgi:hypothetical protein